ncbi:SCO family protein [Nisaea sp.]|uniref:SCO family protein n=1 Tax=Nisaea sp. TaxID=2024842 RepID=UPI002B272A39|nr:SCO family protein [Nisaea sp.]
MPRCHAVFATLLLLASLAVSAMAGAGAGEKLSRLPNLFGGPFHLTDEQGRQVGPDAYAGKFMLVYFGYSYCPDICPTDLTIMAAVLDSLGESADRIQPLLISVDPSRDTPEALREFTDAFHPSLIGLTGTEAEVAAAAKVYRVHRRRFQIEGMSGDDYLVDHSTLTYLMGTDGRFLSMFPRGTTPERMAEVLRKYLSE